MNMIVTELDIERLFHLSINEDDSYREKLLYQSINRDDSYRDKERGCSIYQLIEMIVIDIDIERLFHLSINEYDSYRVRYREAVPSINQ